MTYNTHGCRGSDGVVDVERIADIARRQRPDLLALQEVDVAHARSHGLDQAKELAERLGMDAHFTCTLKRGDSSYGIALLTSHRLCMEQEGCLPAFQDEVRAAQWARMDHAGVEVDILHTHLSVRLRDRNSQLKALLGSEWLERRLEHPYLVVCGDLNALPWSSVYRRLSRRLSDVQRRTPGRTLATWPALRPFARIDHIFVGSGFEVEGCRVPSDRLARAASDHLPLVADLRVSKMGAA